MARIEDLDRKAAVFCERVGLDPSRIIRGTPIERSYDRDGNPTWVTQYVTFDEAGELVTDRAERLVMERVEVPREEDVTIVNPHPYG